MKYDEEQGFARLASEPRKTVLDPPKADGLASHAEAQAGLLPLESCRACQQHGVRLFAQSLDYQGVGDRSQVLTGPFGVPIGISTEFRRVELPFFVEVRIRAERQVTIGIQNQYWSMSTWKWICASSRWTAWATPS